MNIVSCYEAMQKMTTNKKSQAAQLRRKELERELEEIEVEERRDEIQNRLDKLCGPRFLSSEESFVRPKTEVHWDFVMKEMVRSYLKYNLHERIFRGKRQNLIR